MLSTTRRSPWNSHAAKARRKKNRSFSSFSTNKMRALDFVISKMTPVLSLLPTRGAMRNCRAGPPRTQRNLTTKHPGRRSRNHAEAPSANLQAPKKHQNPNTKHQQTLNLQTFNTRSCSALRELCDLCVSFVL